MKKTIFICIIISLILLSPLMPAKAMAADIVENDVFYSYVLAAPKSSAEKPQQNIEPHIGATAAILMDADTGQVLYEKNAHQRRAIASTTKIMTALVAVECGNLEKITTISKKAALVGGSSIHLQVGEQLTLRELLFGALMHSGNDACVAIAEAVAGKEDIFVAMMNKMAMLLGALDTNFCNTNGLPNDKHLSTAYDLAIMTRYALQNPIFEQMVSTKNKSIPGKIQARQLNNTNKMLWGYQGADGVKTGTTNAAGKCLVASATRNGHRLLAVVLHSPDRYQDASELLDYGFTHYQKVTAMKAGDIVATIPVVNGTETETNLIVTKDIDITVPLISPGVIEKEVIKDNFIMAPAPKNQQVGKIQLFANGQQVAETDLRLQNTIQKQNIWQSMLGHLK